MKEPTIRILGMDVIPANDYLGVRYWKQLYPNSVPLFDVYVYVGKSNAFDLHAFKKRGGSEYCLKPFSELNSVSFSPFLLNISKINIALEKLEGRDGKPIQN